jgi:uncharacterized protein (TIGR02265 family)
VKVEGIVSDSHYLAKQVTFEGLIKGLGIQNDSVLLEELLHVTGYNFFKPEANYPFRNLVLCINFLRQKLFPELTDAQAYSKIARAQVEGYISQTIFGRITYAARKGGGGFKVLELAIKNHSANFNFGKRTITSTGENKAQVIFENDPSSPIYVAAMLTAILELQGVKDVKVTYRGVAKHHFIYDFSWLEK